MLSSKALFRNSRAQVELMRDTMKTARFDELERLRELVSQQRARRVQSVTGNGHGLAMAVASAGMSPVAALNHRLSGMEGIRASKKLDDSLKDSGALAHFADSLANIHEKIRSMPGEFLVVAEQENLDDLLSQTSELWSDFANDSQHNSFVPTPVRERIGEVWVTNTQVNFCAQAYPTVAVDHPDAAALTVLGGFLRNGYLHTAIREQGGAYGGGASQDSSIAAFRFYSYRDPRLLETLDDFGQSVRWMIEASHQPDALEQAQLGVLSTLDKPSSPAGEAKQHFHNNMFGRDHAQRERFRARVLDLSLEDLMRVTETYLKPEQASTAVITSQSTYDTVSADLAHLTVEEL